MNSSTEISEAKGDPKKPIAENKKVIGILNKKGIYAVFWFIVLIGLGAFLIFTISPYHISEGSTDIDQNLYIIMEAMEEEKGVDADAQTDKPNYVLWDREKAIEFSLKHLNESVRLGLVGAGALFWFFVRTLIASKSSKGDGPLLSGKAEILMWNGIMATIGSIAYGFFGLLFMVDIGFSNTFSIYGIVGLFPFCQFMLIICASVLLTLSLLEIK